METNTDSYDTEDGLNTDWFADSDDLLSHLNNGFESNVVQISIVDSGADTMCPVTNRLIKWKIPTCSGSQNGDENLNSYPWVVCLKVERPTPVTPVSAWVQFTERQDDVIQVPLQNGRCSQTQNIGVSLVEDFNIHLQEVLDSCTDETGSTLIKLILCFGQLEIVNYDVCQFEIKELQVYVKVTEEEEIKDGSTLGTRKKKQMVTGPHRGRCQRLERKDLKFLLKTNIALEDKVHGYVKRVNDKAMLGKEKAVTGMIEVPLVVLNDTTQGDPSVDPRAVMYFYTITADLDPDRFYIDHPGKELYTSDKTTAENNVFIFGISVSVGNQSFTKEIYHFKTKSKEYPTNKHQFISAMELEATRAHITDLKIQKLTTVRGDIAYSWHLMDASSAGRYDEGDVVGIFPDILHANDKTYLDLLTPYNYKEAILAGVITRSYYIAANSQEDDLGKPSEKICMVGKIPIKVSGPVKHGDFIYASNKLPGVGVTEEKLLADNGNWREKRLLGYSLETNVKPDVKPVSCIVSILLSINNDQIERMLKKIENTLSENVERKIDEFRDDVDIKMDGINEIVNTTQDYVVTKRREISRRTCRVCSAIIIFFVVGILSCYFFLSPTSPYIKWACRRGSLPGTITFKIENKNDEKFVRMEGILFEVAELRRKIDVEFALKNNFTGSYYLNLRKCKRENLRKVLGWFSNPPVYTRAQVFAARCNCSEIFHTHQYHSWVKYDPVFNPLCEGDQASKCNKTTTGKHE